ncbi:hypothetical protein BDD43_3193 [Mucilaginibacter gracilis]|uniref:Uncharacterized protein n=1 Tax=Mucilaginibacter gracilis TaxID=423350 RepID=A0A495J2E7_9SPHI|nr:hypothetical protein [Mucilaginibacter gracilis]RKR82993.1 hypothetical protein BDD43_3193 [Mucilaginibacter gracilis]
MKKNLLFFISILCTIVCSCEENKKEFKIYPLSPFSSQVSFAKDQEISNQANATLKTQYYIVDEDVDFTDRTKIRLENYIKEKLSQDISNNKAIYFTFYKGSFSFTKNSVQTKDELEKDHAVDKLAEFEYKDGKLYNFDFYKEGSYYQEQPTR